MRIIHTADWHLGSPRSPYENGVNLRSQDTLNCLEEMIQVARREEPDYVLVSGDIFDKAEIWQGRSHKEVLQARYIILELSKVAKQVVVMRGTPNHDSAEAFEELQAHFEYVPNVHVITTPQVLKFDDVDVAVLPGFDSGIFRAKFPGLSKEKENEVFSEELSNIVLGLRAQCGEGKKNILMAHYTVPGCNMESGQVMMLTQFEPIISQETLLSAGFDFVALGHIHRPQQVPNIQNCFYSGAINAMNFNDEGQERGFWIHEHTLPFDSWNWESRFYKTPYREFSTLKFTDADITSINLGDIDKVAFSCWRYNGAVQDKIVRIRYNCSAENSKALNKALLEKTLLEDGAFMVWEILPDKIDEFANRTEISNTTEPETNLVKYLEEKEISPEKIQELVEKARPIISAAEASITMASQTGVFEPVQISVKNYRNYEDETFNFEDVSFCTINGQNGAGKSSLFMDAILDCLYEEPREGEKIGWIRNDEKARSGSIMFTFRIGEKTFRVTRTRARSGKGTLNISELVEGNWNNCSKERYNDTQQEILNIIGMDSLTFKSCALIMQDQYGLFLQAKPEERVEVLGTLLGLGVYQIMEKMASDKAKAYGAKKNELKKEVEIHEHTISSLGDPNGELATYQNELSMYESNLQMKTAERDKNKLLLATRQAASERQKRLLAEVSTLNMKKTSMEQNKGIQQEIIDSCALVLSNRKEVEDKIAERNALMERELALAGESALYSSKKYEVEEIARQAAAEQRNIAGIKEKLRQKENELMLARPTDRDAVVKENVAEYERQKKLLDEAYVQERAYRDVEQKLSQVKNSVQHYAAQYEADIERMQLTEAGLKKKAKLLSNVECVDISNAKCGFLADAISAQNELEDYEERYSERKKAYEEQKAPLDLQSAEYEQQLSEMDFDYEAVAAISRRINELTPYVAELEVINQREGKIAVLKADLDHLQSNIHEAEKRLCEVKLKGIEAEQERDRYAESFKEHEKILGALAELEPWIEKERQLPVAEERQKTAMNRIRELAEELESLNTEIMGKQTEADKETKAMEGTEELSDIVSKLNSEIGATNLLIREKQMKIGALQQKAEQIEKLTKEIVELQKKQLECAKEAADYDTLKVAFSRSGVPHQIIRSIIPRLTATSNAILGQMTGGKMGVEFQLERMQKNGKEKVSLDIFIDEYGKPALPYLSKSGGEKVKSSLSVILALAEIKSSSAGIQLGFLEIDEPPFLDSDGTQAYVDALEAIQQRYPDLKVMAITHDQEFKARFPQSVTVYKNEHGSHVRWD
jgi:exonuclease SbcC